VWQVHEKAVALDAADQKELEEAREITVALIQYATPLAAVSLPRLVNTSTDMQAAAPAVEITRLLSMLGVGTLVLKALGGVLLAVAALSVWIALWQALAERRADLAMLRMLGAPPARLGGLLVAQALWLAALGCLLGLLFGHVLAGGAGHLLAAQRSLPITGWLWLPAEWAVPALAFGVALLAAALPAWGAYRVDAAQLLHSA
jgi:putative ABC transport system permease protein